MKKPITVRLPDDLREELQDISSEENVPVSDIVREFIRKYVLVRRFRQWLELEFELRDSAASPFPLFGTLLNSEIHFVVGPRNTTE